MNLTDKERALIIKELTRANASDTYHMEYGHPSQETCKEMSNSIMERMALILKLSS